MKCIKCGIHTKKIPGPHKIINSKETTPMSNYINAPVDSGSCICKKCYTVYKLLLSKSNKTQLDTQQIVASTSTEHLSESQGSSTTPSSSQQSSGSIVEYKSNTKPDPVYVELPFPRCTISHTMCFICRKSTRYILVPFEARKQVFNELRIFIPKGNRCCPDHLLKKRFYTDELSRIKVVSSTSFFEVDEVARLLDDLSVSSNREITDRIGDYTLSEERLYAFTGLNWNQIIELSEMMTSMRNSDNRSIIQALVVFLFKLRSGNSNNIIASVLGLDNPQQVSKFSQSVLNSFQDDILPTRFGIKALTREILISNTSPAAKNLHDLNNDKLGLIFDGTYLRHEKSSNNEYQRKSYSGQKKQHLVKPFTVCTTNGFIVDVLGPFPANQNDATIMQEVINEPEGLVTLLKVGDIFFVDRGFRDVIDALENKGYKTLMPALKGKRKQLSTYEANASRRVTVVRWVVEAVHGIIAKKFKLLHNQLDNKMLPNAGLYCRIACFLVNQFGKRCISEFSAQPEILEQLKDRETQENSLAAEADSGHWNRKKIIFQKLTSADILDFPEITVADLKIFFTGTYQLQQAISYLAEILDDNDEIAVDYLRGTPEIIKLRVKSRHVSKKFYNCYIDYKPNSIGRGGIKRHYCECANGMRTIGCCSHIAAIIYYLSNARYESKIIRPAQKLAELFSQTNTEPVINEDSDED